MKSSSSTLSKKPSFNVTDNAAASSLLSRIDAFLQGASSSQADGDNPTNEDGRANTKHANPIESGNQTKRKRPVIEVVSTGKEEGSAGGVEEEEQRGGEEEDLDESHAALVAAKEHLLDSSLAPVVDGNESDEGTCEDDEYATPMIEMNLNIGNLPSEDDYPMLPLLLNQQSALFAKASRREEELEKESSKGDDDHSVHQSEKTGDTPLKRPKILVLESKTFAKR